MPGRDDDAVSAPAAAGRTARHTPLGQLIRVGIAGAAGWVVDTAVLTAASAAGAPVVLATAAGLACGAVVNFVLNRATFAGPHTTVRAALGRYVVLYLLNVAVVTGVVDVGLHLLGPHLGSSWAVVGAKVVATAAMLPVNTVAYRRWVFA